METAAAIAAVAVHEARQRKNTLSIWRQPRMQGGLSPGGYTKPN